MRVTSFWPVNPKSSSRLVEVMSLPVASRVARCRLCTDSSTCSLSSSSVTAWER